MKYTTFRNIVVISGAGLLVGGAVLAGRSCSRSDAPAPSPPPAGRPTPIARAPAADGALRPLDSRVLAVAKQALDGDKRKDAVPGPWKVNVYRDPGHERPNRVKVDLDRDDKWDEKWELDGAAVVRLVSPDDDDRTYPETWHLAEGTWVRGLPSAPKPPPVPAPATPEPAPPATPPAGGLRDLDRRLLERAGRGIQGDKLKDAFPGETWKVNIYQDAGNTRPNRAKVDLDRDEKWDEKWTFEASDREEVKRQVAPADDEVYTESYRLRAGAWVRD